MVPTPAPARLGDRPPVADWYLLPGCTMIAAPFVFMLQATDVVGRSELINRVIDITLPTLYGEPAVLFAITGTALILAALVFGRGFWNPRLHRGLLVVLTAVIWLASMYEGVSAVSYAVPVPEVWVGPAAFALLATVLAIGVMAAAWWLAARAPAVASLAPVLLAGLQRVIFFPVRTWYSPRVKAQVDPGFGITIDYLDWADAFIGQGAIVSLFLLALAATRGLRPVWMSRRATGD